MIMTCARHARRRLSPVFDFYFRYYFCDEALVADEARNFYEHSFLMLR